MQSRDEFFRLALIALRLHAQSAAKYSVDLATLKGFGLPENAARNLLHVLKPIFDTPEFERYLEGTLRHSFEGILAMIDGICAFAVDSPHQYKLVDETGKSLGEDLHFDFGMYVKEHPEP